MKNDYCDHIIDVLKAWGKVDYRPMFSGFGLYKDEQIFALICDHTLYLKADKQSQVLFESLGCNQFIYEAKGKIAKMSYWSAPEDFFDSPENSSHWADIAFQAGIRSKSKKKPKQ
jgi:DNA transformation protein